MKKAYDDYGTDKNFAARLQKLALAWQTLNAGPLKHRQKCLQAWASGFYDEGYNRTHTLNLIDRGVSTLVPFLVEGNPRVMVESRVTNYRPWAYTTQLALNYFIEKLDLANKVLIPAALNSMFGAAITRTSFVYDRKIDLQDEEVRVGTPWVELIDDTNYIGDPSAKRRADMSIEGDMYTLPTAYAQDFFDGKDKYGNQIADYIKPDCKTFPDYSPSEITEPGFNRDRLKLREYTTFIDLYLKDEGTVVTIMPEGKKAKILRTMEYEGPGDGPYDYLGYQFFPESTIPIPPAWKWYDMDVTVNIMIDKMREAVESRKDIIAFTDESTEDMKKIIEGRHLEAIRLNDVDQVKVLPFGGLKDDRDWQWIHFMMQEQTRQGANPDVLGGKGTQAPTLGQEQMLFANAARHVDNMNNRYSDFTSSILRKLAWAFWTDPTVHVPVIKEIPGVVELPEVFAPAERVGDFYDFTFKIVPYSAQRMSPEIQYQKMMGFLTQWLIPTMQMAAQQGQQVDFPTVNETLADYLGIDNVRQWMSSGRPSPVDNVPFQMQPSGQSNDKAGALDSSRIANLGQQQSREGTGDELRGPVESGQS